MLCKYWAVDCIWEWYAFSPSWLHFSQVLLTECLLWSIQLSLSLYSFNYLFQYLYSRDNLRSISRSTIFTYDTIISSASCTLDSDLTMSCCVSMSLCVGFVPGGKSTIHSDMSQATHRSHPSNMQAFWPASETASLSRFHVYTDYESCVYTLRLVDSWLMSLDSSLRLIVPNTVFILIR